MHDTRYLSDTAARIDYLMDGMDDDERRDLVRLGLLMHVIYGETMSPPARRMFDEVLQGIGPDFLLAFRALRTTASSITRKRKNWRTRS